MKTTLRGLALAAVLGAAAIGVIRHALPPKLIFKSPGQATQEKSEPGFVIRGRVVHDGAGVAGAQVRIVSLRAPRREAHITSPASRQAETDATGRFELTDVPPGPGRLVVIADRLAPSISTLDVPPASEVTVSLDAGVALEGRVAADGSPLAGARVTVRLLGHDSLVNRRTLREGVTDADGRYRLEGLDPARPLRLVILAEGHRPYERSLHTPFAGPAQVDLDPGVQIWGRILSVSGEPVSGVPVQASQGEAYTSSSRSGDEGEVRLGGLIARPLSIRILHEGYSPARLELAEPSNGWTIVLRRSGGLAGKAAAGSWLVVETSGATYRRGLGSDGSFRWEGLPSGPAVASVTDKTGRVLATQQVEIPEGDVADGILLNP